MANASNQEACIVIPTYQRQSILIECLGKLLQLKHGVRQILVIDQTPEHDPTVRRQLEQWERDGAIRWITVAPPSIPAAMNRGLLEARTPLVLFLDDDIRPDPQLVLRHLAAHERQPGLWATVGRVVQPWQSPEALTAPNSLMQGLQKGFDFPFNSTLDADVENVMAGNLCVNRERALSIGGFDENFIGPAYRFETDFARRVIRAGGRIRFLGSAGVDHLRAESGGTRVHGSHLTSASPLHGMGDYYYAFRHAGGRDAWGYSMHRMVREVRTRFHLTHPWWIPVKLVGEMRALRLARRKLREGPRLIPTPDST